MFSPDIAQQLVRHGYDALAASGSVSLGRIPDIELFEAAQVWQRAVVTENVPDFLLLDSLYRQQRRAHYGLILTTDHRFSRSSLRSLGQLVLALDAFLRSQPAEPRADSFVRWLQ